MKVELRWGKWNKGPEKTKGRRDSMAKLEENTETLTTLKQQEGVGFIFPSSSRPSSLLRVTEVWIGLASCMW